MAQTVIDEANQIHGGAGLSHRRAAHRGLDSHARVLRIVDGPDEVHRGVIARLELARYGEGKWSA